jgi:D-arabinose 1-dehydrogenase-like Zn-dependent alcohol dehydrogenase
MARAIFSNSAEPCERATVNYFAARPSVELAQEQDTDGAQMKAIVKTKAESGIDILDLEEPVAGENDILVEVVAGSLCGCGLHVFEWTAGYEWLPMPLVLGHEFAGRVVEIGDKITEVSVGDRITAMPAFPCGECEFCLVGKGDACRKRYALGLTSDGAFSDFLRIRGSRHLQNSG